MSAPPPEPAERNNSSQPLIEKAQLQEELALLKEKLRTTASAYKDAIKAFDKLSRLKKIALTKDERELHKGLREVRYQLEYLEVRPSAWRKFIEKITPRSMRETAMRKQMEEDILFLKHSEFFDPSYYLTEYPDVSEAGMDAAAHYVCSGEKEARAPAHNLLLDRWKINLYGRWAFHGCYLVAYLKRTGNVLQHFDRTLSENLRYEDWAAQDVLSTEELTRQQESSLKFELSPLISIITPVYIVADHVLDDTIRSVIEQTYPNWELCLAVAYTEDLDTMKVIRSWEARDPRIKVKILPKNGGISRNSNSGLEMASGEWIGLLDHDDMLSPDALFEMVQAINIDPTAVFLYSDRDLITSDGLRRQYPLFKPAWAPDIMLTGNYLTHFNVMRRDRVKAIGGWDPDTDGAQDWDLFLRVIGNSGRVVHVPKVLYHWRAVSTSVATGQSDTKPYALAAQLRTVHKYLKVAGWEGAEPRFDGPVLRINWSPAWRPSISLLILPNGPAGKPPDFEWAGPVEIITVAGGILKSDTPRHSIRIVNHAGESKADVLDALVKAATGDILVVWDSGLMAGGPDWLAELVGPLANPEIAVVSGMIYHPNGRVLGMGAFYCDDEVRLGFQGMIRHSAGVFGSNTWYNNSIATPLRLSAMRRSDWKPLGSFISVGRPDLALTLSLSRSSRRIFLNPHATATSLQNDPLNNSSEVSRKQMCEAFLAALPKGDPYVNPRLKFSHEGWQTLRLPEK
jgi:glycosyltransferase involved in cell wall biosynthesis